MGDVAVRPAKASEKVLVTDLVMRSKASNGYDDAFMDACREELRVRDDWFTDHFVVAEEQGAVLGCARLCGNGKVKTFFVDPDAKRRGVGRALWSSLLAEARRRKIERLVLESDPEAESFYARLGFRTCGRVPSGSIAGRTLPLMEMFP